MSVGTGLVPVLAMPMVDAAKARVSIEAPQGLTVAEIIELALPDRAIARSHIRVALVTPQGSQIVPAALWHRAKPRSGVHVIIRIVPGKDILKSILQIVVSIAAVALGQYWALPLSNALGISAGLAQGLITLGATVVGNLLINALIPPTKPSDQKQENRYSISGWRNRIDPDGAVPFPVGTLRYAPPFAALSHSEIVGDWLYIRSPFLFGYGELEITDFQIGETSLSEYDEVEINVRTGVAGDAPLEFFRRQIVEESVGAELTYPYPRDDLGNRINNSQPEEEPVVRSTGKDASGAAVIFAWPAGLFRMNDKGKVRSQTVVIRIAQRELDADEWQEVTTLTIAASQREAFYRRHVWAFPSRGRYQIECTMLTPESDDPQRSLRTTWAALQTIRPEYPLNFDQPLALVEVRIKSTHQLNGQLDNFSALVSRICLDYDHTTKSWTRRKTSNPASIFREVLQSAANPRPVANSGIDLDQLADWHDFCRVNNLKFDKVFDDPSMSIGDVLTEIAAAGRAAKRHDGTRWGVVVDRPKDLLLIDDYSPRNSYGFRATRTYVQPCDGFRIKFLDATNDYKPAERVVPWPGKQLSEVKLTDALEMPGKTDPVEVYLEGRRRQYEAIHRPDVYQLSIDNLLGVATRGDKVVVSQDIIDRVQTAGRVRSASGRLVELDEAVVMEAGQDYALRFRVFESGSDAVGTSIVRPIITQPGEHKLLRLKGDGELPASDSIVFFGNAGKESFELVVSGIQAGQDFSRHLRLVDAAPVIDDLMAQEVAPAWSGRVGSEIEGGAQLPPQPRFLSIRSGFEGTDKSGRISYLIEPGSGAVETASFEIDHRLAGVTAWTSMTIPAANGGGEIIAYANGSAVQMQARAISDDGTPGPYTATISFTIGAADPAIPAALDASMITVGPLLGGAAVQFSTNDNAATAQVQIYRSLVSVLDRATDAVGAPVAVEPSRSYTKPVGDTTRQNLLPNGTFDSATGLTLGNGWSLANSKASHASGFAGTLAQALAAQAGKYYRISYEMSAVTAGTFTPRLTGGTTRSGTSRSTNGTFTDRIQAVTGNNVLGLVGDAAFVGSVDNVVAYLETATCLAQGTHYFWLEPQNEDGVPGPVAGPFTVFVR